MIDLTSAKNPFDLSVSFAGIYIRVNVFNPKNREHISIELAETALEFGLEIQDFENGQIQINTFSAGMNKEVVAQKIAEHYRKQGLSVQYQG